LKGLRVRKATEKTGSISFEFLLVKVNENETNFKCFDLKNVDRVV
jgi:hypothetical protein